MPAFVSTNFIREQSTFPILPTIKEGFSCGHVFKKIGQEATKVGNKVVDCIKKVGIAVGEVRMEATPFCYALKLGSYTFIAIKHLRHRIGDLANISTKFTETYAMIDTLQIFDGIGFFLSGQFLKSNAFEILGNFSLITAGTGGIFLLLDELTVISLAGIGASMGSLPVFGAIAASGVTLGVVVTGTVGVAFAFFAGDAIYRAVKEQKKEDKTQAFIDLAWCSSEVALKSFMVISKTVIGSTSVPGLIVLGSIASVLGISSYLHGKSLKK